MHHSQKISLSQPKPQSQPQSAENFSSEDRFFLRPAKPEDFPTIVALGEAEDMGTLDTAHDITVAEGENGELLGFLRLMEYDGVFYVNPLVCAPQARRRGVGRALMEDALAKKDELRFVARGSAVPFYEKLRCRNVSWEEIHPAIASDCDDCSLISECHPQPMIMAKRNGCSPSHG